MIEAGLVTARFVHYAAVMALFGLALFPLYGCPNQAVASPARLRRWLRTSIRCAALVGLLSTLAWGWFATAGMTGTMMAVADRDSLLTVLAETSFGQVWAGRLALGALLLVLTMRRSNEQHPDWTVVLLAGLLLASLALVGHTLSNDGALRVVHVSADGAHLLAAGAWLGGLVALVFLLLLARQLPSADHTADATAALVRFSVMGYAAVAILVGSGLINIWMMVGSAANLLNTVYGQLLLVKVCLLAGMLSLAAQNRFRLVPELQKSPGGCLSAEPPLRTLLRNVVGEQMLGLVIVLIVSWLGTLQPAIAASQ